MRDIPRPGCLGGNLFLLHSTLIDMVCLGIVYTPLYAIYKMYTYQVHNLQDIHQPGNRDMQYIPRLGCSRGNSFLLHSTLLNIVGLDSRYTIRSYTQDVYIPHSQLA